MNCKVCGGTYAHLVYTDPLAGDTVTHQRRCIQCGTYFWTIEICKEEYDLLKIRADNFQTMISPDAREKARALIEKRGGKP